MSLRPVNLVPAPRRYASAARKRAYRWCWGVGIYASLLLTAFVACSAVVSGEADDKSPMIEKTTRQIDELTNAANAIRPQLTEAQTRLTVARTVGDQPDWSLLLAILSSTVDDNIVLTNTKLDVAAETQATPKPAARASSKTETASAPAQPTILKLTLQGMGRSPAAVTQFVLRIERLGLFERVELARSSRQTVGSIDANVFRVECVLQRSAKPATATVPGGRRK
jgi:hypothetical protein